MMGPRQEAQGALFYDFSIEDHVPRDHVLRGIDRFVELSGIRHHLAPFYSSTGRPEPGANRKGQSQMPRPEADLPSLPVQGEMLPERR